ncbi:tyrosine-type recombinase/integrase [Nocardia sp. NPDC052566]|uniref:tyrosine-type recombinase/integrase n=1 Tax=Nocardia sp. NPDC052566 TaxID=3364330 RepID=UPI0037C91570
MSIQTRVSGTGVKSYRVKIFHRGQYVAGQTFARKKVAEDWERRQYEQLASGTWADPSLGSQSVKHWGETWLKARSKKGAATERKVKGLVASQINGAFGRRPLVSIRPSEFEEWIGKLSREQSDSTARAAGGVFRQIVRFAMRDGAINRDPTKDIKLPTVHGNEPHSLTHEELWSLADEVGERDRDRLLVLTGGYAGLRWGELAALLRSDFDLGRQTVRVTKALVAETGEIGPVKTHQSRTVPLAAVLVEELAPYVAELGTRDLVFPSQRKTPLRNRNFRRDVFDDAVERLALDITPHNLRDTAASLAIQAGASVVAVSKMLGHESPATTLKHYAAFFPSDLVEVAVKLDVQARAARGQHEAATDHTLTMESE